MFTTLFENHETFSLPLRIHVQMRDFVLLHLYLFLWVTKMEHKIKLSVNLQGNVRETFNKLTQAYRD